MRAWLLSFAALTSACQAAQPTQTPVVAAEVASQKRCLLLNTNDSESNFDGSRCGDKGCPTATTSGFLGTIARIAGEKQRQLQKRPGGVLLVEGGDVLQGRYLERQDSDRTLAAKQAWHVYDRAGYDFGTLGNHEFDGGPKVLRNALLGLQRYRILMANLDAVGTSLDPTTTTGRPLYDETALVDCGGIKVGLFGLLTPSTKTISDFGDLRFRNPDDTLRTSARAAVATLKSQGAQVIVALTHIGLEDDKVLAKEVPEIDAIVGGHSHTVLPQRVQVGKTLIVQTGSRFAYLGFFDLALDAVGNGLDLDKTTWKLQEIDGQLSADPQVETEVDALRATLLQEKVIGKRSAPWNVTGGGSPDYALRATRAVWHWAEKTTGRKIAGSLLNAGGFRSNTTYPAGPVTNVDVSAIHPFKNRVVLITLTGEQLRDTMEHACSPGHNDAHGRRAVLAGMTLRCDPDKPETVYRFVDNKPVEILQRGQRVVELLVGGKPYDHKANYTIATLDYLARGGSGYLPLEQGVRRCSDGKIFVNTDSCINTPLLAQIIELAVIDGSLDQPLAP